MEAGFQKLQNHLGLYGKCVACRVLCSFPGCRGQELDIQGMWLKKVKEVACFLCDQDAVIWADGGF